MKKRILVLLTVMALMVVMLAMSVAPAFADTGGVPHAGSCGLSEEEVHLAIENPSTPGASEAAHSPFGGCQGQG
jgi:hypothetical protein